jgi:hypothetical protein
VVHVTTEPTDVEDTEALKAAVSNMLGRIGIDAASIASITIMDICAPYPPELAELSEQLRNLIAPTYGLRALAFAILEVLEAMPDEHIPDTPIALFVMELALGITSGGIPIDEATGKISFQDYMNFTAQYYKDANEKDPDADNS